VGEVTPCNSTIQTEVSFSFEVIPWENNVVVGANACHYPWEQGRAELPWPVGTEAFMT
jgi:hypothetical protein